MRIVVDFLPLMARGGGLQNVRNLWRTILAEGGAHRWRGWAAPELGLEPADGEGHAELRILPLNGTLQRVRTQNGRLLRDARSWDADVVFTPIGVPPLAGGPPRVFGWHDSTIAYPESPTHDALGPVEGVHEKLRAAVAGVAGRRAERVCVQTEAMAGRLSARWGVPRGRFHIVPNGRSEFLRHEEPAPEEAPSGTPVILVVAEPKNAKNLEVVPRVARRLAEDGVAVRWVITCREPGPDTPVGRAVAAAGGPELDWVGRVPHAELGALYRSASVVLLPSWLESFSATYVEAMHFGVPLVTSDMDFARAICGDAAVYADPASPEALASGIRRVLDSPELRADLRRRGFRRVETFPDWSERLGLYVEALEAAVRERAA